MTASDYMATAIDAAGAFIFIGFGVSFLIWPLVIAAVAFDVRRDERRDA